MQPELERQFTRLAVQAGLIDPGRLAEVEAERRSHPGTPLPALLVERGWLTVEQCAQLEHLLREPETARPAAGWDQVLGEAIDVPRRGRYVLDGDEPRGKGGMGQVWLAHDDRLGRTVALKELRAEVQNDPALGQRFLVEAQITGQLQHPGIVPVYDLAQPDGAAPFYTMRFVEGRTLTQAARDFHQARATGLAGAVELRDLLNAFVSVCNTLQYAHSRGVIHRDLKGGNVIVGRYGEVVVLDWGLARVLGRPDDPAAAPIVLDGTLEQTRPGALGTPQYMAPEQALGQVERIDRRTDVFGLGAILYEILTGRPPYAGKDRAEVLAQAQEGKVAAPRLLARWVPRPLEAVCLKALAVRPEDRFQAAAELAEEVKRWLAGEPVRAWPEPATVKAGRWLRRHRVLASATGAALVVVLVLGSAGAVWWQQRQAREALLESARRDRAGERAVAMIDQAVPLRKRMRWDEARLLLKQAGEAVREAENEELAEHLRQAEADLALARALDGVREEAHALAEGKWDPGRVKGRYAAVFRAHGLDVLSEPIEALAGRIRACAVREEILAALDDWMSWKAEDTEQRRLLELAAGVDEEHPWRRQLLQPGILRDRDRLLRLVRQVKEDDLTPATAVFLDRLLGRASPEGMRLLLRARERHPDDFWLNFELAVLRTVEKYQYVEQRDRARQEEAIGYYRAALASKPDSTVACNNLAASLGVKGDMEEAIRYYRKALRLDPRHVVAHMNLGGRLSSRGDLDEGVRHCREAVRLDPTFSAAHNNLGVALLNKKDLTGAIRHCREASRLDPTDPVPRFNLGKALRGSGDLEGAIRNYREGLRLDPGRVAVHHDLGAALYEKRDLQGAIASFRQAICLDPGLAPVHDSLGVALRADGDLEGAIRAHREAIRVDPRYANAHFNLGSALYARKDLEGAIAAYREGTRLDPNLADAHYNLGVALHDRGDVKGASQAFKDAIRADPRHTKAHNNLAAALSASGDPEGAIRLCREAIRLDPNDATVHNNLAGALSTKGDREGAIRSYREAIRLDPKLAAAHANLASLLSDGGDREGALRHCREAARLDPRNAEVHNRLGRVLHELGDLKGAIRSYQQAVRLAPRYAMAYNNLGSALNTSGDVRGAVRPLREAVRLDPTLALAHHNLGVVLNSTGDLEGAIHHSREAIRLDPSNPLAHGNLGNALLTRGDVDGALRSYREVIRLRPELALGHYHVGLALRSKGDRAGAIRSFREAARLDPNDARAHNNLGSELSQLGDREAAIRSFKEAIRANPRHANAHYNLAGELLVRGDLKGAMGSYRQAVAFFPAGHPLKQSAAEQLAACKHLLALEPTLEAVRAGKHVPGSPRERIALASLAMLPTKQLYATAARLCLEALQAQPDLADFRTGAAYNAACAAVRAGTGQGKDAAALDDTARAEWRYRALAWLRDDLAGHARQLARGPVVARRARQTLLHWRTDADLAAVRRESDLGKLPEAEQVAWRNLWAEVAALLARTRPGK
jgi:tetratricopeptide (TPR) repeat protein/tRNA A-37 threonylcarbamoyl transferase component Bud32